MKETSFISFILNWLIFFVNFEYALILFLIYLQLIILVLMLKRHIDKATFLII